MRWLSGGDLFGPDPGPPACADCSAFIPPDSPEPWCAPCLSRRADERERREREEAEAREDGDDPDPVHRDGG